MVKQLSKYVWWSDQNKATFIDWFYWFLFKNFLDKIFYSNFWVWLICKCGLSLSVNSILLVFFYLFMNGLYYISQGLTEYHFPVTKAPCKRLLLLLLLLLTKILSDLCSIVPPVLDCYIRYLMSKWYQPTKCMKDKANKQIIGLINNSNLIEDVQHTVPLYLSVEDFPTPNTPLSTEVKFCFLNCFCKRKAANECW